MAGSTAEQVATFVASLAERSFVRARDVEGPRGAVDTALSRLAARGDLYRVRNGLYWKGASTPIGMSRPRVEEVALQLGGPGSGPAGVAAAMWLGVTSQVPATFVLAVPTRAPKPWHRVRFTQRSVQRLLRDLTPTEVAVLEVLRAGPSVMEVTWERLGEVVVDLVERGEVRPAVLGAEITDEPHRSTRARWAALCATHPTLAAAA